MRTIRARFGGPCAECGVPIEVGEFMKWENTYIAHVDCAPHLSDQHRARIGVLCQKMIPQIVAAARRTSKQFTCEEIDAIYETGEMVEPSFDGTHQEWADYIEARRNMGRWT